MTQIECLVAGLWNYRKEIIVPNVSWGLGIHECDMLIVTRAGYCTEVEIKISRADLKKDLSKRHGHHSKKIKQLFFCIPDFLLPHIEFVPERAGIILIRYSSSSGYAQHYAEFYRPAEVNPDHRKLNDDEFRALMRLGCIRIFDLKRAITGLKNELRYVRNPKNRVDVVDKTAND